MEIGAIKPVDIDTEVRRAYLDYAMSVIVSRALPDARDGLKPVQRRILYAMYDMGIRPNTPYKKSARIVGEVLGKYHPHGDSSIYEAMARMAQDFSVRYLLVEGQGNFGSVDGDPPAAMRYTEARLAPVVMEMLQDIDKDTVDWTENFDSSLKEPTVLPSNLPNLLVNGASGIAVGMSTNIPPHNLGEVVDALVYLLDHWKKLDNVGVEDLLKLMPGPDFPTGGLVYRRERADAADDLLKAYATGRGRITIRARAHIEEIKGGRQRIVITEIPYQVNKSSLVMRIAKLVRAGKLEGIADLRDESDRQGMRLVVDLNRNVDPDQALRDLYRHTPLETRYSIIMLALVAGQPRTLPLKKALLIFLEHRLELLARRTRYELEQARRRAHIVEGLLIALDNLDEVIDTIRRSRTVETARKNLRHRFKLSNEQAQAILDMPLKRLAALERKKLQAEYKELRATIKSLEVLLRTPKKQRGVIRAELLALKEHYADPRRTHILEVKGKQVDVTALAPDEPVWLTVTRQGHVGRTPGEGHPPRIPARPQESPVAILAASTRDTLTLFTAEGMGVSLPVHQISKGEAWQGAGSLWSVLTHLQDGDVVAALALPASPPEGAVFFVTAQGRVKRMLPEELPGVGREPIPIIRLDEGDWLVDVVWVLDKDEVVLGTAGGQGIRFAVAEVRPTGVSAGGVAGIRLVTEDVVTGVAVVQPRARLLTITGHGMAKRTPFSELPRQRRGGKGVQIAKLIRDESLMGVGTLLTGTHFVSVTQRGAAKTLTGRSVKAQGRATRGASIIALRGRDLVAGVIVPRERLEVRSEE
ncbi:MAG: DNA gyrase subunit A [Chloroflexi bacterium]|nr:MAG: DNA gyrase subunit A [Chloroflexota bacterium]